MPDVDLMVVDRFFASGPSVTADVFATANLIGERLGSGPGPFRWRVLTRDGRPARSSAGLSLGADGCWSDGKAELKLVFGVGMADERAILASVRSEAAQELVALLRAAHRDGNTLMASCSSTFLLAETGCLHGGRATTSWWLAPLFRQRYPSVQLDAQALVTEHERAVCAGAAMAQLDLALFAVRRFCGMDLARSVARYLVIDDGRASQAPYLIVDHLAGHDEVVSQAMTHIRERLAKPIELASVAKHCAVSERTLRRRFTEATGLSPSAYIQRTRAERAAELLRTTDWSVGQIADAVGYAEDGALRRAFQRHFGKSPSQWRAPA